MSKGGEVGSAGVCRSSCGVATSSAGHCASEADMKALAIYMDEKLTPFVDDLILKLLRDQPDDPAYEAMLICKGCSSRAQIEGALAALEQQRVNEENARLKKENAQLKKRLAAVMDTVAANTHITDTVTQAKSEFIANIKSEDKLVNDSLAIHSNN